MIKIKMIATKNMSKKLDSECVKLKKNADCFMSPLHEQKNAVF